MSVQHDGIDDVGDGAGDDEAGGSVAVLSLRPLHLSAPETGSHLRRIASLLLLQGAAQRVSGVRRDLGRHDRARFRVFGLVFLT